MTRALKRPGTLDQLRLLYRSRYEDRGLAMRLGIDLSLANIGLFLGFLTTVLYHLLLNSGMSDQWMRGKLLVEWPQNVLPFTLICALMFILSRLYSGVSPILPQHRFRKAALAVCLAFLVHNLLLYFLTRKPRAVLPASALLSGWIYAMALIGGIRVARNVFFDRYKVVPRQGAITGMVKHVLVIGGAGYVGSTLVRHLLDSGYRVRVLDKLLFGDVGIRELNEHQGFEFVDGDFRNVETTVRAVRGVDAVIHVGAIVGDPACALDDEVTVDINTNAVRMIREACRGYGIRRFLFASTCSVYGAAETVLNEDSALAPVSLYAKSKIDAEEAILELSDDEFQPTILRLATAFGLSHRMRFDLVVNLLTAKGATEGKITIFNGHQWRPFIHVKDIARAFAACLRAPVEVVGGQIFNAGDNDWNLTIDELGEIVKTQVGGDAEITSETHSDDPRSYRVDFSKIRGALDFECTVSVRRGIRELAEVIQSGKFEAYTDPIYSNVATMKNVAADVFYH